MEANEKIIEAAKLVDGVVDELRGFDSVPPPKGVWLKIAERLKEAFGQYQEAAQEAINETTNILIDAKKQLDDLDHMSVFGMLAATEWKETMFGDLQTHDFGDNVFMLRCKHGEPNEHYLLIKAADVDEAISRAVFDLHKPSEQVGRVGKIRNVLSRVHDWLGALIRDGRPDDSCSQCIGASDLADDVYDALHSKVLNCDRFNDETEAMVAFLNEVWLISVTDLKDDPFDEWTPEMKARYAKWLMELKDAKEGGDKCEPTEQKA